MREQTSLPLERLLYVTPYWQRRYFVIDIQHLIILVKNNISQRNLVNRFKNLLWIEYAKRYSYSFRFDIFIARCLGGPFLPDTLVGLWTKYKAWHLSNATYATNAQKYATDNGQNSRMEGLVASLACIAFGGRAEWKPRFRQRRSLSSASGSGGCTCHAIMVRLDWVRVFELRSRAFQLEIHDEL